ncbi:Homeodomain-like protein, partial [Schizophyllum amplum]
MVYRHIDPGIKQRALEMLDEGHDIDVIAAALAVHKDSISRWYNNYDKHGTVTPPITTTGRPRLLGPEVLHELSELVRQDPGLYLDEIMEWLALEHDQPISMGCLCNNLREIHLHRKLMHRVAERQDPVLRTHW